MPLSPRNHAAERYAVEDRRACRRVLTQLASDHGTQAIGVGDEVDNQQDLDLAQHYGFVSRPPAETELVVVPGDPIDASVAEVCDIPSGDLGSIASGETALYDSSGNFVYLRGSNGVWLKTLAGPVTIEAKTGQWINLSGASPSDYVALANKVKTELDAIRSWANSHVHVAGSYTAGATPVTGSSGTGTSMAAPSSVASAKVKAD